MEGWRAQPTLRQKQPINLALTDLELFEQLPLSDVWDDARLVEVYQYLRQSDKLMIPHMWEPVMDKLDSEINKICPT